MNIVEKITQELSATIETLFSDFTQSRFIWDTTKNFKAANKNYYAIRPLSANFVAGTCRTVTLDQTFEIELGTCFRGGSDSDEDADEKIYSLYEKHQELWLTLMRTNLGIQRVQVISSLDLSQPEVDNENKVCRIIASYSIKHRTEKIL